MFKENAANDTERVVVNFDVEIVPKIKESYNLKPWTFADINPLINFDKNNPKIIDIIKKFLISNLVKILKSVWVPTIKKKIGTKIPYPITWSFSLIIWKFGTFAKINPTKNDATIGFIPRAE